MKQWAAVQKKAVNQLILKPKVEEVERVWDSPEERLRWSTPPSSASCVLWLTCPSLSCRTQWSPAHWLIPGKSGLGSQGILHSRRGCQGLISPPSFCPHNLLSTEAINHIALENYFFIAVNHRLKILLLFNA